MPFCASAGGGSQNSVIMVELIAFSTWGLRGARWSWKNKDYCNGGNTITEAFDFLPSGAVCSVMTALNGPVPTLVLAATMQ